MGRWAAFRLKGQRRMFKVSFNINYLLRQVKLKKVKKYSLHFQYMGFIRNNLWQT
jgi:hypothetical protein